MAVIGTGNVPTALRRGLRSSPASSPKAPQQGDRPSVRPSPDQPALQAQQDRPQAKPGRSQRQDQPQGQGPASSAGHRAHAKSQPPIRLPGSRQSRHGSLLATVKRMAKAQLAGHNCGGAAFHDDSALAYPVAKL